jgi:glucose-6-phosphate 1-dehydrogenase
VWVDTDRWRDVPFLLRTGKRMKRSAQRVSLLLRPADGPIGALPGCNVISLSLAGSGSLDIGLIAKQPGPDLHLAEAAVSFDLRAVPGGCPLPPYSSLIHDVLVGDRSLFTSSEGLATAWSAVQPLLDRRPEVQPYPAGGMGPAAADALAGPGGWLLDRTP